ncbi:BCCT family transporter [Eggerthella sinensis]|uniref:BCCT family transporter n=1 Tax=Eggerthella sinensis TaxID=242230 RepID=UPI0022E19940|nr:BCCT family transporter [Eggerthella sinensis]
MRSNDSDDGRAHARTVEEIESESGELDPEPKHAQAARLGRTVRHDYLIRAVSVAIVLVVVGIAVVSASTFIDAVGALRTFVTQYCSWWIVLCAFLCFVVCVLVAVTKYGTIRLGGADAKPAFSYFSWFAMLFATGQGVGLVFWAVAEPIMMYGGTPVAIPDPLFAGDAALAWTYFHWAIPAWAIYAIVSLFMCYARYNMHKDTTFRGTVEDLFPARAKRPAGIVVEILVVIATIFGLTTSLGLASYQFNSGIQQIFHIQTGAALQVAFVILFGCIATMSVWFGVVKGIKNISNFNAVVSIVFVVAVFIFGPTLYILGVLPESLSVFVDQFMLMSGFTEATNLASGIATYGDSWQAFWSFFIFCWCFAFATFTAGFVSTISRGRTLREFVGGVVFVPAAVCIVWTCVVGGTGVWAAMSNPDIVAQTTADSSMGLFLTIDSIPLVGGVLTVVATILIGGYIVTSVDSGVMALSNFVSPAARQSRSFKAVLALCITALAVLFMVTAGQDFLNTIQFATIAGGIPFSIVVLLMGIQFFKWVRHDEQLVARGLAEPFPAGSLAAKQLAQWHEEKEAREAEEAWRARHEQLADAEEPAPRGSL